MKILVIEDDAESARYIAKGLRETGLVVDIASDGRTGLVRVLSEDYDLAIVDRMLPELDGLSLVERLRGAGKTTRVLFLSAMSGVQDRVRGLKSGGDDYLAKPFAFSELLARVEARAIVDLDARRALQDLEPLGRKRVADEDLRHWALRAPGDRARKY